MNGGLCISVQTASYEPEDNRKTRSMFGKFDKRILGKLQEKISKMFSDRIHENFCREIFREFSDFCRENSRLVR